MAMVSLRAAVHTPELMCMFSAITAILACVAACCVGCVENMIQWFNKYA